MTNILLSDQLRTTSSTLKATQSTKTPIKQQNSKCPLFRLLCLQTCPVDQLDSKYFLNTVTIFNRRVMLFVFIYLNKGRENLLQNDKANSSIFVHLPLIYLRLAVTLLRFHISRTSLLCRSSNKTRIISVTSQVLRYCTPFMYIGIDKD